MSRTKRTVPDWCLHNVKQLENEPHKFEDTAVKWIRISFARLRGDDGRTFNSKSTKGTIDRHGGFVINNWSLSLKSKHTLNAVSKARRAAGKILIQVGLSDMEDILEDRWENDIGWHIDDSLDHDEFYQQWLDELDEIADELDDRDYDYDYDPYDLGHDYYFKFDEEDHQYCDSIYSN